MELEEGDDDPEGGDKGGDKEDEDVCGDGARGFGAVFVDKPGEHAPDGDEGDELEAPDEGEKEFGDGHCSCDVIRWCYRISGS